MSDMLVKTARVLAIAALILEKGKPALTLVK